MIAVGRRLVRLRWLIAPMRWSVGLFWDEPGLAALHEIDDRGYRRAAVGWQLDAEGFLLADQRLTFGPFADPFLITHYGIFISVGARSVIAAQRAFTRAIFLDAGKQLHLDDVRFSFATGEAEWMRSE